MPQNEQIEVYDLLDDCCRWWLLKKEAISRGLAIKAKRKTARISKPHNSRDCQTKQQLFCGRWNSAVHWNCTLHLSISSKRALGPALRSSAMNFAPKLWKMARWILTFWENVLSWHTLALFKMTRGWICLQGRVGIERKRSDSRRGVERSTMAEGWRKWKDERENSKGFAAELVQERERKGKGDDVY